MSSTVDLCCSHLQWFKICYTAESMTNRPSMGRGYGVVTHFLARDVMYTSRAYATMPVSVCLSVCLWCLCIVVTRCDESRISLHAWIDGCLCYLLTTPHPDRPMGWCRDFWWMWGEGVMEKMVVVVISLIILIFFDGPETRDDVECWQHRILLLTIWLLF